jgi:general secretion pathway protein M
VTIASTENLPVETRGGYRRIGLRFTLSGPYETLLKLIAKLEAATPPLVVENLHIHGVLRRPGAPSASALDAGLDVFGFRDNDKTVAAKP